MSISEDLTQLPMNDMIILLKTCTTELTRLNSLHSSIVDANSSEPTLTSRYWANPPTEDCDVFNAIRIMLSTLTHVICLLIIQSKEDLYRYLLLSCRLLWDLSPLSDQN